MKNFIANKGVPLDASLSAHRTICEKCRRFDLMRPATLALLCLEGSRLWKVENTVATERISAPYNPNYASAAEVKKAMRYK